MKNNKKILYVLVAFALVLSVAGISVGFAAMSTQLTVTGTTTIVPATWKIKFQNLSSPAITGTAKVVTAPEIQSATHIGDYSVELAKPGDSIVYTFEIANLGSIDSELSSYTFATPTVEGTGETKAADEAIVNSNLVYTLTYADGKNIQVGDTLAKGTSTSLKLTIAYASTATELPTNSVTINGMDITFVYEQQ